MEKLLLKKNRKETGLTVFSQQLDKFFNEDVLLKYHKNRKELKDKILCLADVEIYYNNKEFITSIPLLPNEDEVSLHEDTIHLVDDNTSSVDRYLSDSIPSYLSADLSAEHNDPSNGDTLPPHDSGNILQATTKELFSAQNDATNADTPLSDVDAGIPQADGHPTER